MSSLSIKLKKRLLSGSLWAFTGKTFTSLSALAVSALLTRLLTPEDMGAYFLIFSLVSIATVLAQLGLTQTVVRLIAESMGTGKPGRARQSIILVLKFSSISSIIVVALIYFGVGEWVSVNFFHSEVMISVKGMIVIWIIINIFQHLISEVFRGFHNIHLATIFGGLITSLLSTLLFLSLWISKGYGSLGQIIALALLASISSLFVAAFMLWKRIRTLPRCLNMIEIKEIVSIAWPLWITNLVLLILTQVDLWMLGLFRSQNEVAVYGAAAKFMVLVVMPLVIVNLVIPPIIAEMFSQGKIKELEKVLRTTAAVASVPSLVMLSFLAFIGGPILGLVYGDYYSVGKYILIILAVGQLINVWAGSCGMVLMLTGHQFTMMVITIFCGLLVTFWSWLLVPKFGGEGAAAVSATGMLLQNLLMLFFAKKKTGVWTHVKWLSLKELRLSL